MQSPQSSISQKRNQYRVEIRRQKVSKILALKRIRPQAIQSDGEALQILLDGLQILEKPQSDDQTMVTVFKSIADTFKKYEFDGTHLNRVREVIFYAMRIFSLGSTYQEIIKQSALQLLSSLSFNQVYGLTFESIPFEVLTGFKQIFVQKLSIQMIRSCLLALSYLLSYLSIKEHCHEYRNLFGGINIMKKLLGVVANFSGNQQCFSLIKPLFMNCAVTLCYISHQFRITPIHNDHNQLLGFCLRHIQADIIREADQDPTLNVYFQRYYQPKAIEKIHEVTSELSYPFGNYELLVKTVQGVNSEVVEKLTECLRLQIRGQSVEEPLLKCLTKIYYETNCVMQDDLKEEVFAYIFGLEYAEHQQYDTFCLRHLILMMLNEFVNSQALNGSIFSYMGDSMHKKWPKTCHLLEVMEYLEIKTDFLTQQKLLELVDAYLTICGGSQIINECLGELYKFDEGTKWLKSRGYLVEGIDERMELIGRGDDDGEQKTDREWEI